MGALANSTMYLSAPIEFDMVEDWRKPVKEELSQRFGIKVFDPAADEKQKRAEELERSIELGDFDTAERIAKDFVKKDLSKVDECNFLIACHPWKVPSCGTPCEVQHAVQLKKPVMIVCPEGKKKIARWYLGNVKHKYIFGSWKELYDYLDKIDSYQEKDNHRWWVVYKYV